MSVLLVCDLRGPGFRGFCVLLFLVGIQKKEKNADFGSFSKMFNARLPETLETSYTRSGVCTLWAHAYNRFCLLGASKCETGRFFSFLRISRGPIVQGP